MKAKIKGTNEVIEKEVYSYLYRNKVTRAIHEMALKRISSNVKDGNILDVGCGDGKFGSYLSKNGHVYFGVDINKKSLAKAKLNFPHNTFFHKNLCKEKIPLDDGYFDSVVSLGVLEHLPNLDFLLQELNRLLKKDGKIVSVIPSENWLWGFGRKLTSKRYIESKFDVDYEKWVREEQHINTTKEILGKCRKYFRIKRMRFLPFHIPLLIYFEMVKK